ncbi:MAG: hypothetical protein H0U74_05865 [Bradymonadaceae bacterium]|nr:hypothetical protein [Lujinxingiaceae bacterium]
MRSNKTIKPSGILALSLLMLLAAVATEALAQPKTKPAAVVAEPEPELAEPKKAGTRSKRARPDEDQPSVNIEYRGVLQDETGSPLSGVFPLEFKLHRHHMGAESIWSERHFVAVVDGRYVVPLGGRKPLRPSLLEGDRWMAVELVGEGEILRDRLVIQLADPSSPGGLRTISPASAQDGAGGAAGGRVTFAEVAERATIAERARIADSAEALGELTVDEIEKMSNLALERLGEHLSDPNAHQGAGRSGGGVGTERRTMEPAGGRGGVPYDIRCPPGHVVTGIEGRAGRVLDSLQIVCSPLK